jgi:hypothetical protein
MAKQKLTVELIKEIGDDFTTTSTGKKVSYVGTQPFIGEQIIVFHIGSTVPERDLRMSEVREKFTKDGKIVFPKGDKVKLVGVAMSASRFIEIQAALAFERIEWSKMEPKPDFDTMVSVKDFSEFVKVL